MNKRRIRFGIKIGGPIFPNLGVFILRIPLDKSTTLRDLTNKVRDHLSLVGYAEVAGRLICEDSGPG